MIRRSKILIGFLLILVFNLGLGQTSESPDLTMEELTSIQRDLDYDKTKTTLVPRFKQENAKRPYNPDGQGTPQNALNWGSTGSIIGYILSGLILIILVYFIIKAVRSRPQKEVDEGGFEEVKDIQDMDFESILEESLSKMDFRTAIRVQFLIIMQLLTNTGRIKWKPHKTNQQYSNEINDIQIKERFRKFANTFDVIWYGNAEVDQSDYNNMAQYARDFHSIILENREV